MAICAMDPVAGNDGSHNGQHGRVKRNALPVVGSDADMVFAVLRPLKTSEVVARDIVRDIIDQGLRPGDSLPAEPSMLELYGVSRESLREGLRLLEVQGLITIRRGPGGGPAVGSVDATYLGRILSLYYHMAGATYRELFEAWVLTQGILAERAARHPDPLVRASAMKPYLDPPDAVRDEQELEEYVQAHLRFHGKVAELGRNHVLGLAITAISKIVSHNVATTEDPREMSEQLAHDHHELARAIVAGHAKRARSIMESHIETVAAVYAERLGDRFDDFVEWV
jgi:DNA-binding FadR family transcriptional regulator